MFKRNPATQYLPHRAIDMKKAKDRLVGLGVRHRVSKLRQHTFSIFRMNPLAKRIRIGDVIRIKP